MKGWRAWTADGKSYLSSETPWVKLPREIVGVVIYLDPPYRRILDGFDWIWKENGEIVCDMTHEEWGKTNPAPRVPCSACLKKGVGVEDSRWKELQKEMVEAREWPS